MKVSIITATTGAAELRDCLASVHAQSYQDWEHLVVIDGAGCRERAMAVLAEAEPDARRHVVQLPEATGAGGFQGHRTYAAFSYLAAGDLVAFLDEDNWYESHHVATLVDVMRRPATDWCYALRRIVDRNSTRQILDNCESLGTWPTYINERDHLVDVSCYCLPKAVAIAVSPLWMVTAHGPLMNHADRRICRWLLKHRPRAVTSGLYSVNYRAGSRPTSVRIEHFEYGNRKMAQRYGGVYPWLSPNDR